MNSSRGDDGVLIRRTRWEVENPDDEGTGRVRRQKKDGTMECEMDDEKMGIDGQAQASGDISEMAEVQGSPRERRVLSQQGTTTDCHATGCRLTWAGEKP